MTNTKPARARRRFNWAPYLLILPSALYLTLFFAWPMGQALVMAVREEGVLLRLRGEAERGAPGVGQLPRGAQVEILDRQANLIPPDELGQPNLITEQWFHLEAQDAAGATLEGWAPERRIRVREFGEDGEPIGGTVRAVLAADADPLTAVHAEPSEGSEVVGHLETGTPVAIFDQATLEIWYLVRSAVDGQEVEGWVQSRYVRVFGEEAGARIEQGDSGRFTMLHLQRMVNDRFFWPAFRTTLLLVVLIVPAQFVLAIIMALVIQANLKGSSLFLYIFAIALGVSDVAVGIVWYSIFTQFGYLNSILQRLGLIDFPITYLSANTTHWIIIAIWLAELWRSTAIVMVIVVSGLQAISHEVLEAAEVFGANLWQRVRYVILPMLKPSLQVALILRTILALQVFAVVIVLGGGTVVTVLANETYRQYYTLRNVNLAAAYASFILILSLVASLFYLRVVRTQQEVTG
jgi:multiple sugar transport system permease protein